MSKNSLIPVSALVGLTLVFSTGCQRAREKAVESAIEKAVEKATGGKATIDTGSDVDISGLPENLRYPNAKATGKFSIANEQGSGTAYTFEAVDPAKNVVEFYKKACAGMKQSAEAQSEGTSTLVFASQDDKEIVSIAVSTDKGKTTFQLFYSKKQ